MRWQLSAYRAGKNLERIPCLPVYHEPTIRMTMTGQTANPKQSPRDSAIRRIEPAVVFACSLVFAAFLVGMCLLFLTGNHPAQHDIVSYWAAGRQILHRADPYDSDSILKLERTVGFSANTHALIMRNPPWALCLMLPLGLLGPRAASLLWSTLLLAALIFCVHSVWAMNGRPNNRLQVLGYTFAPALICIVSGQTALFALVGLVLFLRFHHSHQFSAGLSLWLCSLKPHLFLPFGVVLLLWIVASRSYRLVAGAAMALAASIWVAMYLDPSVWTQYIRLLQSAEVKHEFIPCLGVALRLAVRPQATWLQYVPAAVGCIWGIVFYWMRRGAWDWQRHGALLMMVSILVSPYAWITDQSLLIPAVLNGVYRATSRVQIWIPALLSTAIELLLLAGKGLHSGWHLWSAPAWLAWYLYVSGNARVAEMGCRDAKEAPLAQGGAA
jgi:hypothetical protein